MSKLFDDAKKEYLFINVPAITNYPFAMACWFNSSDDVNGQILVWVGNKDVKDVMSYLAAINSPSHTIYAQDYHTTACNATTSTTWNINTWNHAAGIWLSATERHAYLNGGGKGNSTANAGAISGFDRTAIGAALDSTPGAYMSGMIAEVGIWDLTNWGANDAERETNFEKAIVSMAKGFSPKFFPLGLKLYCPLVRLALNIMTGAIMGESGTLISPHCRVFNPVSPKSIIT